MIYIYICHVVGQNLSETVFWVSFYGDEILPIHSKIIVIFFATLIPFSIVPNSKNINNIKILSSKDMTACLQQFAPVGRQGSSSWFRYQPGSSRKQFCSNSQWRRHFFQDLLVPEQEAAGVLTR